MTHSTDSVNRLGTHIAATAFESIGFAFREQLTSDFGIDAQAELRAGSRGTGELLALQIKSGSSYFREPVDAGWWLRTDAKHAQYWLEHSLPVLVIQVDVDNGSAFWEIVTSRTVTFTEDGGAKILIRKDHKVDSSSGSELRALLSPAGTSREAVAKGAGRRVFLPGNVSRRLGWLGMLSVVLAAAVAATLNRSSEQGKTSASSSQASTGVVSQQSVPTLTIGSPTQLTTSGDASRPAITPDGKLVVYARRRGNAFSLWLQPANAVDSELVTAAHHLDRIVGATVTPDGQSVDFVAGQKPLAAALWRVPLIGVRRPRRLIEHVESPIGWSRDGQQMAFVVSDPDGTNRLIVANADGTKGRTIVKRQYPSRFVTLANQQAPSVRPAWSPDGHAIALAGFEMNGSSQIVFADVDRKVEHVVPMNDMSPANGLEWFDDTSLLVIQAANDGPAQLWRLPYPTGLPSRLSNDTNDYRGISVSADRASLTTERIEVREDLWVGDADGRKMNPIVERALIRGEDYTIAWIADRLFYTAVSRRGSPSIFRVSPPEQGNEELVSHSRLPVATKDGRTLVYVSVEAGKKGLWKRDSEGHGSPQLLAAGDDCRRPALSRDDQDVLFLSARDGSSSIWKVAIDGKSTPQKLLNEFAAQMLDVSPDGKRILFGSKDEQNRSVVKVCDLPSCSSRHVFETLSNVWKWKHDGQSVAYIDSETRTSIWVQPLDGTGPHRLTNVEGQTAIADFAWSRDATHRLAVARYSAFITDIVLFKTWAR